MQDNSLIIQPSEKKRYPILESLRGLASIIVLYHHTFKLNNEYIKRYTSENLYSILNFISELNYEAVLFFFILSGFSIGLSLRNKSLLKREVLNEYLYRRLKRIIPIYWLALILSCIAGLIMSKITMPDYSLITLIGNILFLQTSKTATPAWFIPYGQNGPLWSLSYEFFFYGIFPLIYWLNSKIVTRINSNTKFVAIFLFSIFCILINKIFFIPYVLFFTLFPLWLLGYLSSITFIFKKRYSFIFYGSAVFGIAYLMIGKTFIDSDSLHGISKGLIMNLVFYQLILRNPKIIDHSQLPGRTVLSSTISIFNFLLQKIGRGSFALYAIHYPVLLVFQYFKCPVPYQIPLICLLIPLSIFIEDLTLQFKLTIMKRDYFPIHR